MSEKSKLTAAVCALALVAAGLVFATRGAQAQQTDRAKQIGKRLMCMCGCKQILTACNHVGCQVSGAMLKELDQRVAQGDADDLILQSFVQEYGTEVIAEPPTKGFDGIAWFLPSIALVGGLAIVIVVILRWARRPVPASTGPKVPDELLARARAQADRETED